MSSPAPRDGNFVTGALFHIDGAASDQVMPGQINQSTGRVLVDFGGAGVGTVTTVSVATANGFAGSVANPTTTPAITLSTTITGVLKGNGTAISAATGADLPTMTATVGGAVPTPPNNTTTFLRGDGTFAAPSAPATSLTVGTTAIASGTDTKVLFDNAGVLGEYTISGSGNVAMTTSPVFTTPSLGVATATSINKMAITAPATSSTLAVANGKTATISNTLTFTGTDGSSVAFGAGGTVLYGNQTITLSGDVGGSGATAIATTLATVNSNVGSFGSATQVATFTVNGKGLTTAAGNVTVTPAIGSITGLGTGVATFLATPSSANLAAALTDETGSGAAVFATSPALVTPAVTGISTADLIAPNQNVITVTANAGSASQSFLLNKFTNSSAATMTITIPVATPTPKDGQFLEVRIYDFSAVAQTIAWVNTENSATSAPTTSNGSTTLPLSVLFQYNASTSKWRCIAST